MMKQKGFEKGKEWIKTEENYTSSISMKNKRVLNNLTKFDFDF